MPNMGKHGAGSIVTRKHGPPYHATLIVGGRRIYRYAQTEAQAKVELAELVRQRDLDLDPTRLTVAEWLRSWIQGLRDAKNQRVRPRTLTHYTLIVERHCIPNLGRLRLPALRESHVQRWLDAETVGPRTVHHHRAVLRRALNVAVRQRLIAVNPAIGVELPDATYHGAKPLSLGEARAVLVATQGDRLHPLWRMAMETGLRQSELLGIGWDDVDFDAGTVKVTGQLQRIGGAWVRTATKADRDLESLAIGADMVAVLREHQRRMAEERKPEWEYFGHLFVTPRGQPIVNRVILREWHAACAKAGIAVRRFHDLRHSHATLMKALGVAEDTRMARMGQSTVAMARRYGKASEAQDREAVDALSKALAG